MCSSVVRRYAKNRSSFAALSMVPAGLVSGALLLTSLSGLDAAAAGEIPHMPKKVSAVYSVSFNGFIIGSFKFQSKVNGSSYTLNGDAELSALLGAFKWRGISQASGQFGRSGPKPAKYTLAFEGSARSGSIKVGFDDKGSVNFASVLPPFPVASDEVPLQRKHLSGALDPLTAVMALTLGSRRKPCDQQIAIFDGKQRFDLKLAYRRKKAASSFPGQRRAASPSVVCAVDYRPLGGYRMTGQTQQLAKSTGIEIAMLPVPGANLVVPQEVHIPTSVGSIFLSAEKISITHGRKRRIALLEDR